MSSTHSNERHLSTIHQLRRLFLISKALEKIVNRKLQGETGSDSEKQRDTRVMKKGDR